MPMYVFRNHTVENLFDEATVFSGYADISQVPDGHSEYVWFYQVPVGADSAVKAREVLQYEARLSLVASQIPVGAVLYVVSLVDFNPIHYCDCDFGLRDAVEAFNDSARSMATTDSRVRFIDLGEFLAGYPSSSWINWKYFFLSQMIMSPALAPAFKEWWSARLATIRGLRHKCIVLDLDNTLWGGILGEDGPAGIKIGNDYPGNAFGYFQAVLAELARNGVILTVCSKNNEADVAEVWRTNPNLLITDANLAAWQINWDNKADNIRILAQRLNIGLDSMVFVDDNPTERELVRQELPMVAVPDFPRRPSDLPVFAADLVDIYFRSYALTDEDRAKTEQYKANARRSVAREHFSDITDFIRSLGIVMTVSGADDFNIARLAQMSQKTNQFNLTTRRYTDTDIRAFAERGDAVYCLSVKDRFGDNGITGELIARIDGETAHVDTLLMSCRVLGKRIEYAFVATVLNDLRNRGIRLVKAEYIPTAKNSQVSGFYEALGFSLVETSAEGMKYYELELSEEIPVENLFEIHTEKL